MTEPVDLDAVEALCEAATPGPWVLPVANVFRVIAPDEPHTNKKEGICPAYPWRIVCDMGVPDGQGADARFIAEARTAVPALIARCRELTAERDRYMNIASEAVVVAGRRRLADGEAIERLRDLAAGLEAMVP